MKKISIFVGLILLSFSINAQKKLYCYIGPEVAIPSNGLSKNLQPGIGIDLKGEYFLNKKFAVGVSAEYLFFNGKHWSSVSENTTYEDVNADLNNIKAGGFLSYYFATRMFVGVDVGYSNSNTKQSMDRVTEIVPNGPKTVTTRISYENLYDGVETNHYQKFYLGYNVKKYWQAILSYTYMKNAYGRTVQTEHVKSLSYIGLIVNYQFGKRLK